MTKMLNKIYRNSYVVYVDEEDINIFSSLFYSEAMDILKTHPEVEIIFNCNVMMIATSINTSYPVFPGPLVQHSFKKFPNKTYRFTWFSDTLFRSEASINSTEDYEALSKVLIALGKWIDDGSKFSDSIEIPNTIRKLTQNELWEKKYDEERGDIWIDPRIKEI